MYASVMLKSNQQNTPPPYFYNSQLFISVTFCFFMVFLIWVCVLHETFWTLKNVLVPKCVFKAESSAEQCRYATGRIYKDFKSYINAL